MEAFVFCCGIDAGVYTQTQDAVPFCLRLLYRFGTMSTWAGYKKFLMKSDMEEIAKYVLIIFFSVSEMLDSVYLLFLYRYAVWYKSDVFYILTEMGQILRCLISFDLLQTYSLWTVCTAKQWTQRSG